jgi:iron complex outermembrane recepter protein
VKLQSRLKGAAAPVALSIALMAQPVLAQDEAVSEDELRASSASEEEEEDDGLIVVTGSRIRQTEATSASPLQIIDPSLARRAGRNDTAEMIQSSPIANGSSQVTAAISSNAVANGGPGTQTVSLRGLGAERTLVLLNSRRAGPAGTRGGVSSFDLNVLPSSIVAEVQILKDGASSVYGSDAVAGVVNILTKTQTEGLELTGFATHPFESGGESYTVSGAWGKDWGSGHLLFAGEYFHQEELERRDRDYLDCDVDYVFRTPDGDQRADVIDPRTGQYSCDGTTWGHVWAYSATNVPQTNSPATLFQYSYPGDRLGDYIDRAGPAVNPSDVDAPAGWFPVSYNTPASDGITNRYHPFERKDSVIPESRRWTAFMEGSLDLFADVELYAEGLFNRRSTYIDTHSQFYNFGLTGMYAPGDPDDPFPGWGSAPGEQAFISPTGILDQYDQEITVDYYRGVLGLSGTVQGDMSFDVHGQYSRSDGQYQLQQILKDAITQQTDRAYGYGCAGLFTPISNRECLQMNWVDPRVMYGDLTEEEQAYLLDTETGETIYTQMFLEASVTGSTDLFGYALGGVIRRDEIDDTPGHITRALVPGGDPDNDADYVDNAFANNFSSGHTYGYSVTKELFGEVQVPLISDVTFIEDLTVSASARLTNVKAVRGSDGFTADSTGNWTYSFKGSWAVTDWLRFRGTYGTSYRAPALFEQLLASQVSGARQVNIDPCVRWAEGLADQTISQRVADNCAADGIPNNHTGAGIQASVFSSGGIGVLEPETSTAWTASVVLTPRLSFLPNTAIDITVDYFDITVEGEIAQLAPRDILYSCYDAEDFPTSEFCDLFERGQDGNPNNVRNVFRKFINIDEQINRGFDFTVRVRQDLGDLGELTLLGQATLQTKDIVTRLDDFEDYNGEVGDPKFTADINGVWDIADWSFFYGIDIIGASSTEDDFVADNGGLCDLSAEGLASFGGSYCYRPWTEAVVYHNLSISRSFMDDKFEITAGVSNLFDTAPPQLSGVTELGKAPFVSNYDWLGRRAFLSIGAKF